jgi:hypothetical protein
LADLIDVADAERSFTFFMPVERKDDRQSWREHYHRQLQLAGGRVEGNPLFRDESSVRGSLLRLVLANPQPSAHGPLNEWRTWWNWMMNAGHPEGVIKIALIVGLQVLVVAGAAPLVRLAFAPLFRRRDEDQGLFEGGSRCGNLLAGGLLAAFGLLIFPGLLSIASSTGDEHGRGERLFHRTCIVASLTVIVAFATMLALLIGAELVRGTICHIAIAWMDPDVFFRVAGNVGVTGYHAVVFLLGVLYAAASLFFIIASRILFLGGNIVGIVHMALFLCFFP